MRQLGHRPLFFEIADQADELIGKFEEAMDTTSHESNQVGLVF